MTHFKESYVYESLSFTDLNFGDNKEPKAKDWIHDSHDILKVLRENLQAAQNQ